MPASLAIGDFARATQLSVKTLRHYHRIGLLDPADVRPATGHRRYTTDQIPTAQVIRRFRALEMPLDEIRAVIAASDLTARNELIAAHLSRLEANLLATLVPRNRSPSRVTARNPWMIRISPVESLPFRPLAVLGWQVRWRRSR